MDSISAAGSSPPTTVEDSHGKGPFVTLLQISQLVFVLVIIVVVIRFPEESNLPADLTAAIEGARERPA